MTKAGPDLNLLSFCEDIFTSSRFTGVSKKVGVNNVPPLPSLRYISLCAVNSLPRPLLHVIRTTHKQLGLQTFKTVDG